MPLPGETPAQARKRHNAVMPAGGLKARKAEPVSEPVASHGVPSFLTEFMERSRIAGIAAAKANGGWIVGELLDALKPLDGDVQVVVDVPGDDSARRGLGNPHSYRGYYDRLALEPTEHPTTVQQLRIMLRGSCDEVFTGYKGGDFRMTRETLLHVASYGSCGRAVVGLADGDTRWQVVVLTASDEELGL